MIWFAWFLLSLESLVIVASLWMMWVRIAESTRAPADPFSAVERTPERLLAQSPEHPPETTDESSSLRKYEDLPALLTLE